MRKITFLFCVLMIVPTLTLASGDMMSISELRYQVEAMGRWTQTYEAYGRTIEVDVPIIVPEVDELPIVTVQAYNPYSETEFFSCDHLKKYENSHTMGWSFEENALYGYLNPEIEKGKNVDYNQYKDEEECVGISVKLNAPQEILSIGQKDHLKYKEQHVYPWQVSMNEAYAEDGDMALFEAIDYVQRIANYYYGSGIDGYDVEFIEIRDRARKSKTSNPADMSLGETVDYYPSGTYYLHLRPKVNGIPIYEIAPNLYGSMDKMWNKFCQYYFRIVMLPLCSAEVMSRDSFSMSLIGIKEKDTLADDIALASVQTIIREIEKQIDEGKIRNIYALRLGYVCFLNEESPESYTLYPIWICECDYTQSAKEDGSVYIADAGLREGTKFTRVGFNAQTGKLLDKQNFSWNDMYCPTIQ